MAARGWLAAHKWWLLRRASQITALALFMAGPWLGIWWVRGNFASSDILGVLRLSDPFILMPQFLAELTPQLAEAYPGDAAGTTLFPFRRIFLVACR